MPRKYRLIDQVRMELRVRHYSFKTEEAYVSWIRRYIRFHGIRHPRDMGEKEVFSYLSFLAVKRNVSTSTQNQALSALLFLYRDVLGIRLDWLDSLVRAKKPKRLPEVLTKSDVRCVLNQMDGACWIVVMLLYGAGLRLLECLRSRVKDIDFGYHQIIVREGKGRKDRITMLPDAVTTRLQHHLEEIKELHERDLKAGRGSMKLPGALARKYPHADRQWGWQWVFPATRCYTDRQTGKIYRHHLHETVIQRAVKVAVFRAGIHKRVTCHTFRHSFATHLL